MLVDSSVCYAREEIRGDGGDSLEEIERDLVKWDGYEIKG